MKLQLLTTLALALKASAITAGGFFGNSWKITNPNDNGSDAIEFSWKIPNKVDFTGYYMAMQYAFVDREDVSYCGLQPQEDGTCAALFSSFGPNVEVVDNENCSGGADGGDGASCRIIMSQYTPGTQYYIQISRDGNTWTGKVTDKNGYSEQIGSWTLPSGTKGIDSWQMGFLEAFADVSETCQTLPSFEAYYYKPTVEGKDTEVYSPHSYGKCDGQVDVKWDETDDYQFVHVNK